jgi:RNA polymerase sigma-70 factor (ECF subfamily)
MVAIASLLSNTRLVPLGDRNQVRRVMTTLSVSTPFSDRLERDERAPDPVLPRVALGDSRAIKECLSRYSRIVYSLALKFLGNATDADDATQDVFIELWKNAERFDPSRASESTFVTMVARRRLIDYRRKASRQMATDELPESLPERRFSPQLDARDEACQARSALQTLREEQRNLILLAIDHGLTHEEISVRTGYPIGTVKTHIRRGLMKLREVLASADEAQP